MGEAEAKKRRIFAALGILWATVAAATSTGEQISLRTIPFSLNCLDYTASGMLHADDWLTIK